MDRLNSRRQSVRILSTQKTSSQLSQVYLDSKSQTDLRFTKLEIILTFFHKSSILFGVYLFKLKTP